MQLFGLTLAIVSAVFAQDNEAKKDAKLDPPSFNINGYVDAYYSYNLNRPGNSNSFGSTEVGRIFDGYHNQIVLGLAQIKSSYENNGTEVVVDIVFGPNAELANFGNSGTSFSIKQAYFSRALNDKMTFTIGQYGTHIGYELVDAPDNFHYSLSYLFGNGPFYHTGAKIDYALNNKMGVMLGVVNGWDKIFDDNKGKSVTAQFSYTPNDTLNVFINWIGGNEAPSSVTGDSISAFKHMVDLTASFSLSEKFSLGINSAVGFNSYDGTKTNWGGVALYLTYTITGQTSIGVRGEYFDDTQGSQYLGTSYTGFTITASITDKTGSFIFKPEFRLDKANDNIYFKGVNNSLAKSQSTFGLAFIGKF